MRYISWEKNEKIRIAFLFQVPSFWPSWETLYEECIKCNQFDVKIMLILDEEGEPSQMRGAEKFLLERKLPFTVYNLNEIKKFRPHYAFFQTPYDKGHRKVYSWTARLRACGIRCVYIPYGIEISDTKESRYKHFQMSVVRNAFLVFVMSESIREEYRKYCPNYQVVKPTGLPRFDAYFLNRKFGDRSELEYKIDGRKVILWKVHFPKIFVEHGIKKQATPSLKEYIKFINYIEKTTNLFFIFMPHPKFADEKVDEDLLPDAKWLLKKLSELKNVFIDFSDDYRCSLSRANAIMVDRSAVMVEAGLMHVPVLYLHNAVYEEPMTEPVDHIIHSYYQGVGAEDMEKFCKMVQEESDPLLEEREKTIKKEIPCLDGKCAGRIKNELINSLMERRDEVPPTVDFHDKKIVFWGAGGIAKYCFENYETSSYCCEIIGIIDNDYRKQGDSLYKRKIFAPSYINKLKFDYIVIATDFYFEEVRRLILQIGMDNKKIIPWDWFVVMMEAEEKTV